jgi:hypothetical protein
MRCSVYQALRAVQPWLSEALVPPQTRQRLFDLAKSLPEFGGTHYVECRLSGQRPSQVDLLVSAVRAESPILRRVLEHHARQNPGLDALRQLVERWSDPGGRLFAAVPAMWIEFDDVDQQSSPAASVCVCVAPSYDHPFEPIKAQPPGDTLRAIEGAISAASDGGCTRDELSSLQRCVSELPKGAHWIHFSMMTARTPAAWKLYGSFPDGSLLAYLEHVGWAGNRQALCKLLEDFCPKTRTAGTLYVDLPITGMHNPATATLGICFSQQQMHRASERSTDRRDLMSALVRSGLAPESSVEGLREWVREGPPSEEEPTTDIRRWFDVKLVQTPTEPFCKIYLGFAGNWIINDQLEQGARSLLERLQCRPRRPAPETN